MHPPGPENCHVCYSDCHCPQKGHQGPNFSTRERAPPPKEQRHVRDNEMETASRLPVEEPKRYLTPYLASGHGSCSRTGLA